MADTTTGVQPRERHPQRDRMLALAEAILEREGLVELKARRLAHDAHCSVGTLYNVFKDLDDVILQVNERTLQQLEECIASAIVGLDTAPLEARLLAVATCYLRFALAHTSRWRVLATYSLPDGATVPASYRDRQMQLWRHIETPLSAHIADDDRRRHIARTAFASIFGIVAQSLDRTSGDFDADETSAQINVLVSAIVTHVTQTNGDARHSH